MEYSGCVGDFGDGFLFVFEIDDNRPYPSFVDFSNCLLYNEELRIPQEYPHCQCVLSNTVWHIRHPPACIFFRLERYQLQKC
jgi:hypothetical protein